MNTQDPKYYQKSKSTSSPEQNYFLPYAMRYPVDLITYYMNRKGVVHNHLNNCHAWLTMIVCTFRMALHIGCTTTYYVDKGYSKVGSVLILNLIHNNNNLTNN